MNTPQGPDYELRTPGGFLIKIKPSKLQCVVFWDNRPEIPKSGVKSIEQPIPCILFVGQSLQLVQKGGEISLAANRSHRLHVPYRQLPSTHAKTLNLSVGSTADEFPVYVQRYETVKEFMSKEPTHPYKFIVLEPELARIEMVTLKVRYPECQILVLREEKGPAETESSNERAADILATGRAGDMAGNPVFLARVHLRNLDIEKTRSLLLEFKMTDQEIQFIRTFLQIMIKNEQGRPDLERVKENLLQLDELYRLTALLAADRYQEFDAEFQKGISPALASQLIPIIEQRKNTAKDKEEEIRSWEWEVRLGKVVKGV